MSEKQVQYSTIEVAATPRVPIQKLKGFYARALWTLHKRSEEMKRTEELLLREEVNCDEADRNQALQDRP